VLVGRLLAGTEVARIVGVDAVNDVGNAAVAADLVEAREQFVLAVEAAVGAVAGVVGVIELVGLDVLVADTVAADEGLSVALV
jgi:hypothetical protein